MHVLLLASLLLLGNMAASLAEYRVRLFLFLILLAPGISLCVTMPFVCLHVVHLFSLRLRVRPLLPFLWHSSKSIRTFAMFGLSIQFETAGQAWEKGLSLIHISSYNYVQLFSLDSKYEWRCDVKHRRSFCRSQCQ